MSKDRFRFLKGHICFDNPQERTQLWETDRFGSVRKIWEIFNSIFSKHVAPSEYLSIDDKLFSMRQQSTFRQYNPNKLHRYGLLLKSLNDEKFPYTYKAVLHPSKPNVGDGSYYLRFIIEYINSLVTEMEVDQSITDRTITTDCLSPRIESTNRLLGRGIAKVGHCRKREAEYHLNFLTSKAERFLVQFVILKRRRRTFAWHLAPSKQSQNEKKNGVVLSGSRSLHGKTIDDDKGKPWIINFYDFTKGGTDVVDQLNVSYTTRSWYGNPVVYIWYI